MAKLLKTGYISSVSWDFMRREWNTAPLSITSQVLSRNLKLSVYLFWFSVPFNIHVLQCICFRKQFIFRVAQLVKPGFLCICICGLTPWCLKARMSSHCNCFLHVSIYRSSENSSQKLPKLATLRLLSWRLLEQQVMFK